MEDKVQVPPAQTTEPCRRASYEEEKRSIDERWSRTELFKDIEPSSKRAAIAIMLENQRLINECGIGNEDEYFKKKLIPLVRSTWMDNLIWNWVSVQPMLGPVSMIYYLATRDDVGVIQDIDVIARTRKMKTTLASDFGVMDRGYDLAHEIECEVLNDLWNNAGSVAAVNVKALKTQSEKIDAIKDQLHDLRKHVIGRGVKIPNFLVVNPDVKSKYGSAFADLGEGVAIYQHSGVRGALWGNSGDGIDTSYVYSPYVPFTTTPLLKYDQLNDARRYGLLTRYGKRLLPNGSLVYGKLSLLEDEENL